MTTVEATDVVRSKLPLGRTIALSYSSYFHDFTDVLRICWLWILLAAVLVGVNTWLQASWLQYAIADIKQGVPPQMGRVQIFGYFVSLIVMFAGFSIAVAWHRRLLLDEPPQPSVSNIVTRSLWRYIGTSILIFLVVGLPAVAIIGPVFLWVLPQGLKPNPAIGPVILIFVVYIAAAVALLRFSMLLPARAVGDLDLTFKQAWRQTRGNTWRIFWGLVVCSLPPLLVGMIVMLGVVGFPNPETLASGRFTSGWIASGVILNSYYLLILPISIGFLSHAYRHFFQPEYRQTP
jgi:hypothetical protein